MTAHQKKKEEKQQQHQQQQDDQTVTVESTTSTSNTALSHTFDRPITLRFGYAFPQDIHPSGLHRGVLGNEVHCTAVIRVRRQCKSRLGVGRGGCERVGDRVLHLPPKSE